MDKNNLNPCRRCGKPAIIETWSSGGTMFMAKCSNPDCFDYYPRGRNLPEVINEWNLQNQMKEVQND